MAEIVVRHQAAIGLAAELAEFLLVDALEQRALVPARARIELQVAVYLRLADVHHPDLEGGVGFGVEDEVVQAAPRALDLLEFRRVKDLVDLRRQLLVKTSDHLLDGVEHIALDDARIRQRLGHERLDGVLDLCRGPLAARLEALLENGSKLVDLCERACALGRFLLGSRSHDASPHFSSLSAGAWTAIRSLSAAMSCGSARSAFSLSSAPTLPSM